MGLSRLSVGLFTRARFLHRDCNQSKRIACAGVRCFAASGIPQAEKVAFISGGSRGLGLEYVRQLLQRDGQSVVAGVRSPDNAADLQQLQKENDRLQIVKMDITDEDSIEKAVSEVKSKHKHLDLLINATGFLHDKQTSPETSYTRLNAKNLLKNYQINAMGPILVAKSFAPLLINAAKENGASNEHPAVLASMSAKVGSIGDNNAVGGWHSYRSSKAALNQLNKCISIEFARKKHKVACVVLHPGTVDTDLSEPFQKNVKPEKLFSKERAINQLLDIIDEVSMEDNGRFIAWDKSTLPW